MLASVTGKAATSPPAAVCRAQLAQTGYSIGIRPIDHGLVVSNILNILKLGIRFIMHLNDDSNDMFFPGGQIMATMVWRVSASPAVGRPVFLGSPMHRA